MVEKKFGTWKDVDEVLLRCDADEGWICALKQRWVGFYVHFIASFELRSSLTFSS